MFSYLLNINWNHIYICIQTLYLVLCLSTFGSDYSLKSSWIWCYKLGTPVFGEFLPFFSANLAGPVWSPECSGVGFQQGSLCTLIRSSLPWSWLVSQSLPQKNTHCMMMPPRCFTLLIVPGSSRRDTWHSGQRVQSWFHQTRESCFSWSENL